MDEPAAPMTSYRPYLLRALWEWIVDNGMTPHLLVDATQQGVRVPPHTIKDGRVVLNIADRAVGHLQMGNDAVSFHARFGGVSHAVHVPLDAVLAIYARETGQGMALPEDVARSSENAPAAGMHDAAAADDVQVVEPESAPGDDEPPTPPASPPKRGHLRVVK